MEYERFRLGFARALFGRSVRLVVLRLAGRGSPHERAALIASERDQSARQ